MAQDPDRADRTEALLNPEALRTSLLVMAVFIAAFELLKERVVSHLQYFFAQSFTREGPTLGKEYEEKVLSLHQNEVRAALLWFRRMDAISDADIDTYDQLRNLRNEIAHELLDRIGTSRVADYAKRFADLVTLLRKIEAWWILKVELPGDEEWADREIDESEITPGPILGLQVLVDAALGPYKQAQAADSEPRPRRQAGWCSLTSASS